ncbi:MAG: transcriptional repressor [Cyanobacteria bacterium NC_groundwater_1444_Ag_S-0.65um_54_12]|nr:transcriptional repressor [Cyanobacteria bacterium NC_groundwater_1444_Ag_S-0.65um_54_12]
MNHSEATHDLRLRGYRVTPQRERILQVFYDLPAGTHLSAEELHQLLSNESSTPISLATAYRTLRLLASLGMLRELDFSEGHKHYELNRATWEPHQHLVCVECSTPVEFTGAAVADAARQVAEGYGFEVLDIQLKIHGVCATCRGQGK